MTVTEIPTGDLKPYEKNPRKNDSAVKFLAKSIETFGFKIPIVIDSDKVIVCGHTRLKAAKLLGIEKVPCVIADDLTPEKIKAFRLADNKTAEIAEWDFEMLDSELNSVEIADFDMSDFGFEIKNFSEQKLNSGEEIDAENFDDEKFDCTCPKCGFKFNR